MTFPTEWVRGDLPPGVVVTVPKGNLAARHVPTADAYCNSHHPSVRLYACDRPAGHWGRHATYNYVTGEVRAVWDKPHAVQAREGVDLAARRAARALARRVA